MIFRNRKMDALLGRLSDSAQKAEDAAERIRGMSAMSKKVATLEGDSSVDSVYVYDGGPISGIKKGERFYADVVTKRVILRSRISDNVWDTGNEGVALSYGGKVFAATNAFEDTFRRLAKSGYTVRVLMQVTGSYKPGIPKVKMLIPDIGTMNYMRDTGQALTGSSNIINLYISGWTGPGRGARHIEVETRWVPTPEGSSAKPHIIVSVNGEDVDELSARSSQYAALAKHVGEKPDDATCKPMEGDGAPRQRLRLVYIG